MRYKTLHMDDLDIPTIPRVDIKCKLIRFYIYVNP